MKVRDIFIGGCVLLSLFIVISFAQMPGEVEPTDNLVDKSAEQAKDMMAEQDMMGMCPMHGMMMGSMMTMSMVATGDGGVIVLSCGKLMKFDSDLKLLKEASVPIDTEAIESKMKEIMEKCPKCNMMSGGMMRRDRMRSR